MPWSWRRLFLVGVIVSYVEAKRGVGDAFLRKAFAGETKSGSPVVWAAASVSF